MTLSVSPLDLPATLRPSLEAALDDAERLGDIPAPLHVLLRDSGALRLLTPREFGGAEIPLSTALQVYERFGYIDGSIGLLVWNANFGFVAAMVSESGAHRIWADGAEPTFANSGSPGFAEVVPGGYRLSGEWKIVSGISFADWFITIGVVTEGGEPRVTEAGSPEARVFAIPRDQLRIENTWEVSGMRATGSNKVVSDDAFIPSELVSSPELSSRIDRPLYRGFLPALVFPGSAAVVLGIARAAIDEAVGIVVGKTTMTGESVAQSTRAQYLIASSEAALAAAKLLLLAAADSLQESAESTGTVTIQQRANLRAAMTHAADVSRATLVTIYELVGSTALYRTNRIERLFRDGMAALQHANNSAVFLEAAGRVRLGLDPGLPLF